MFPETRERYLRLLDGMDIHNPFVRFLLWALASSIVLTAVLRKITCMCWPAVVSSESCWDALRIYFAGCLAVGVCAAAITEGTRPWAMGEPSSIAGFVGTSLASLPVGLVALPLVVVFSL